MTKLNGTSGSIVDGRIQFSVPISKVDTELRMVHGFATLDNIDLQGDIVPLESSIRAFEKFRGNIREMHNALKAVGKMVSFRPERYYDPETGTVYNGIFVSVYVSKGAEDTWQKCLDGTLAGFSIGGVVTEVFDQIVEKGIYRVIADYFLTELSLVDNPANQFANIISIEKNSDGGYLSKTAAENVFWCKSDNTLQITASDSTTCFSCKSPMQNIGFVESNDDDRMTVAKNLLANAKNAPTIGDNVDFDEGIGHIDSILTKGQVKLDSSDETLTATEIDPVAVIQVFVEKDDTMVSVNRRIVKNISSLTKTKEKEVENMEDTDVTIVEEVIEKAADAVVVEEAAAEEPAVEVEPEVVVEESTVVEEVVEKAEEAVSEPVVTVEKQFTDIQDMLKGLTEALVPMVEMLKSLGTSTQTNSEAIAKMAAELDETKVKVSAVKADTDVFGKRVDAVEGTTAFRKSADLGEQRTEQPLVANSKWGGSFLDTAYYNN